MTSRRAIWPLVALSLTACVTDDGRTVAAEPAAELRPVIGASDVIEVRVFGEDELSGDHRVTPEGNVRLPLVGPVAVEGLTPEETATKIAAIYNKDFLREAHVTVNVKEFNSRKVFVLGQVQKPGSYPYEEDMTVIAAVARAGGTSKLADLNGAIITRSSKKGEKKKVKVAIGDIRRGEKPDVPIEPGDIIFVPESPF